MSPEPPKTLLPDKCDAPESASAGTAPPSCCWHHYMAYWLEQMETPDEPPQAAGSDTKAAPKKAKDDEG